MINKKHEYNPNVDSIVGVLQQKNEVTPIIDGLDLESVANGMESNVGTCITC